MFRAPRPTSFLIAAGVAAIVLAMSCGGRVALQCDGCDEVQPIVPSAPPETAPGPLSGGAVDAGSCAATPDLRMLADASGCGGDAGDPMSAPVTTCRTASDCAAVCCACPTLDGGAAVDDSGEGGLATSSFEGQACVCGACVSAAAACDLLEKELCTR